MIDTATTDVMVSGGTARPEKIATVGEITSATDTARTASLTRTRIADESPNQPYAGLSSV